MAALKTLPQGHQEALGNCANGSSGTWLLSHSGDCLAVGSAAHGKDLRLGIGTLGAVRFGHAEPAGKMGDLGGPGAWGWALGLASGLCLSQGEAYQDNPQHCSLSCLIRWVD